MIRRDILLVAGATAIAIAGCTTSSGDTSNPATKRAEIDSAVDNALTQLHTKAPGSRELEAKAVGVLVIPKVVSAGFVVGGSYGQGALRKHGVTTGYYSVGSGSIGLLAGAETKSIYLLFMTQEAMAKFESSQGWTAGADANIALADVGATANVNTKSGQSSIVGYVFNNAGLMANLSLDGTKFNKLDL